MEGVLGVSLSKWDVVDLPTAQLLGEFEPQSVEWLELRRNGVGGSDVGAILGLSPWVSPFTLWARKLELIAEQDSSPAMRAGSFFERPIKEFWLQQNPGWQILETGTWVSKEHEWAVANPDGILVDPDGEMLLLEVKTSRFPVSELPPSYRAQVLWYLWILGLKQAKVVYMSGFELSEFDVTFDAFEQAANFDVVSRWWDYVQSGEQPDWDGATSTLETVREMHPDIDVSASVELGVLGQDLLLKSEELARVESDVRLLKCKVMDAMGSAKSGLVDGVERVVRAARKGGSPYLTMKG